MILPSLGCEMALLHEIEDERQRLQNCLDGAKTQVERNKFGQFATPIELARDIVRFGITLISHNEPIRFLDPAFGTGSFFSALLSCASINRIETAKGFELDTYYGEPALQIWNNTAIDLELADFTKVKPPSEDAEKFNFIMCNPPYVRHHHIVNGEKLRLRDITEKSCDIRITGLSGLYCYFLCLTHSWMRQGGIAGWLIPSEFMDVNYGQAVKQYLLSKVKLLRIHRFDPNDIQFNDALVSSVVVLFSNEPFSSDHSVEFTFGGSLFTPAAKRLVPIATLKTEAKWTRFPLQSVRKECERHSLSDFFTIKRGIATGSNKFFILSMDEIEARKLPLDCFRPILPSPRYLTMNEIMSNENGLPLLDRKLFLLDCRLSEVELQKRFPLLCKYIESGKGSVSERYLCRSRKVWYFQDERPPTPILCTYMGRNTKNGKPFRFILNHSQATAANVYLLLYPKGVLANAIAKDETLLRHIWKALNDLSPEYLLAEGRVYGGGLHKIEPKELSNVDATAIASLVPNIQPASKKVAQIEMF